MYITFDNVSVRASIFFYIKNDPYMIWSERRFMLIVNFHVSTSKKKKNLQISSHFQTGDLVKANLVYTRIFTFGRYFTQFFAFCMVFCSFKFIVPLSSHMLGFIVGILIPGMRIGLPVVFNGFN